MSHKQAKVCTPSKEPNKRPLFTEKLTQSKKVITTLDKKDGALKVMKETVVTTHTLEKGQSVHDATEMTKSVLQMNG